MCGKELKKREKSNTLSKKEPVMVIRKNWRKSKKKAVQLKNQKWGVD